MKTASVLASFTLGDADLLRRAMGKKKASEMLAQKEKFLKGAESNKINENFYIVQIAGLIARRIICNLKDNQEVIRGQRIGIIKFGSRVDLYLPKNYNILVAEGQRVVGGETIISNPNNIKNINTSILK